MHETELLLAVGLRHLERLFVVCSGMLAIWLGYRLFLAMPNVPRGEGEGKVELPGGISIFISRVGPGVFFAMFGAIVLGYSLHEAVKINTTSGAAVASVAGTSAAEPGVAAPKTFEYSGVAPATSSVEARAAERMMVLDTVHQLASLAKSVEGAAGRGLGAEQRTDAGIALRESRKRLLASVWDESAWGSFAAFQLWLQKGEVDPVPADIAAAVRAYRGGS